MPEGDPDSLIDVTDPPPDVKGEDTRTVPLSVLQVERRKAATAAKALAEAQAKAAALEKERDEYRSGHEAWSKHSAAEKARTAEALSKRIASLPDDMRAEIESDIADGMSEAQILRGLDRAERLSKLTAPAVEEKPTHPIGGRSAGGAPAADELTPEIKAWVETQRPDLRGVSPDVVRKMHQKLVPKKK
jgi:hypothetical protein